MADAKDSSKAAAIVAYQGSDGAYSQLAVEQYFGETGKPVECRGYPSFEAALRAVECGAAHYAMQPIENTTAGSINEAYDLLAHMNLYVVGEEVLRIQHCLVGLAGAQTSELRRIYSHPQALLQCSRFLGSLTDCSVQSFADTATSVKRVRDEHDRTQAAIASERAAQLHGLQILQRDIANQRDNFTRFVLVARTAAHYDEHTTCKTSLIFTTRDEQGALVRCLNILAEHGLNLTKIESRPRPETPWEYLFYVDVDGNIASANVAAALSAMQRHTIFFKVLGSYPARVRRPSAPPSTS
ncbi:MAG TPA: prephenate dehydratase [Polyangiales bacterium]